MRVFKSEDYGETMELLRRHATVTAHFARILCKYTTLDSEFAFMEGLVHDVGIAGTLLALSDAKGRRKSPPELIAIGAHHQAMIGGHAHPLSSADGRRESDGALLWRRCDPEGRRHPSMR